MSGAALVVRAAQPGDGAAFAAIYAPYVRDTAISFEAEPPDALEFERRVAARLPTHPWLAAERGGRVVGYAYAARFRDRAAYDWSTEVSVYVDSGARGGGVGRALYERLLACLARQGFHLVVAGATLPNPESAAFHAALGFRPVGTFEEVGWKRGAWWGVGFFTRTLAEGPPGASPRPFADAQAAGLFDDLLGAGAGSSPPSP